MNNSLLRKDRKVKVIYNPFAGKKRKLLPLQTEVTLENIKDLFERYEIPADFFASKSAEHATKMAVESLTEGYCMVVAAGGDGTVAEIINGLVGTDVTLGILPLGSFMNIARMLSIPRDLEQAIIMIKIGHVISIDVGSIILLNGQKTLGQCYFLEQAGIGLEARMHYLLTGVFERGEPGNLIEILKLLFRAYRRPTRVFMDGDKITTSATLVMVANAPYGWAALRLNPKAKLNDHLLTVSLFNMSRLDIVKFILQLTFRGRAQSSKIRTFQATEVRLESDFPRAVHADARIFGTTPVEFKILPGALKVISGFPAKGEPESVKRTYLNP